MWIIALVLIFFILRKKRKHDLILEALSLLAIDRGKSPFECKECKYFLIDGTHNGVFGTCIKFNDKPFKKGSDSCPYYILDNV